MSITVKYFASVREKLGPEDLVDLLELDAPTMGALLACLQTRSEVHGQVLDESRCLRMARNQALCDADESLADGDEVAFFPPVTGG
jgi:molybdopterin synthase sulfur carrier subunit